MGKFSATLKVTQPKNSNRLKLENVVFNSVRTQANSDKDLPITSSDALPQ